MFLFELKKMKRQLAKLYAEKHRLEDLYEVDKSIETEKSINNVLQEIDTFIENDFAKLVFEHYSRKHPILVERSSNKKVKWKDAFGDDFGKVSKSLRHSLVGLVTDEGRYKL